MLVHVSDPAAIPDLSDYLRSRADAIVERRAENELETWLVGSYGIAAMDKKLGAAVREWESAQPGERCLVEITA
jgi:hypothetical protein